MSNALVLFAHGSRNAAWRTPFERIAEKVRAECQMPVELAFLELMSPTLPEVLQGLANKGIHQISIVPLFFGLGNHVTQDLQNLLSDFNKQFPDVLVKTAAPLGESDVVLNAMAEYVISQST